MRSAGKATAVSVVFEDTVVETVYLRESAETVFAVCAGGDIQLQPEWKCGSTVLYPVRAKNNLIRHGALVLPSEPAEFGDVCLVAAAIDAYIRRYVVLSDQALAVATAYVILSWVYDAFNELPYLRFRGDYGTGKTRALLVIGSLCYKAFFASGASTVSPIFHTLDTFKGTLVFDEADFRFTDEKAELVKILNNGNVKGFPVLRTQLTPKNEFDPRAFTIFGPKIVGMRRTYEDRALESRFLTIEMAPVRPSGIPINLPDRQKVEALELRNQLLTFRLKHRLSTRLDPTLLDENLEPRMNQILLPLLSVAPTHEMRTAIRELARGFQANLLDERSATTEGQLLSVLAGLVTSISSKLPISEIARVFATEYGKEYERPIANRWIGGVLRQLGISIYKSMGVFVLIPGQETKIANLCERYGVALPAQGDRDVGTSADTSGASA